MRTWFSALSLACGLSFAQSTTTLPSFSLPDANGQVHQSSEYQGKVVLMDFWATWCSTCKASIPQLNEWNNTFGPKGLVIVGVSQDQDKRINLDKIKKFSVDKKMSYQVLWDQEGVLAKSLDFNAVPSLFLFDSKGQLVKAFKGYTEENASEITAQLKTLLP